MSLIAVIPVKPFEAGKARLAGFLSREARAALCRRLFEHVLDIACAARGVDGVIVVSRDDKVRVIAESRGVAYLEETDQTGLNAALSQARACAINRAASSVLVLPADLPFVTAAEIGALIDARESPSVVIAPDEDGEGTNALLITPAPLIEFAFGPGSYGIHCAAARKAGVDPVAVERPGLAFDLDAPDDLSRIADRYPLF